MFSTTPSQRSCSPAEQFIGELIHALASHVVTNRFVQVQDEQLTATTKIHYH